MPVVVTEGNADATAGVLIPEIAFAIMFCTLFVGGAAMAMRTGRVLDATTDSTHRAAALAAAQRARNVERERIDALVHDSGLSTLLSISAVSRRRSPPRWPDRRRGRGPRRSRW